MFPEAPRGSQRLCKALLLLLLLLVLLFLLLLLQNEVLVVALLDSRLPVRIRVSYASHEKLHHGDHFQPKATHANACPGSICSANIRHAERLLVAACKSVKFGQYGFQSHTVADHKQPPFRANLDASNKNFVRRHSCELWIELFRLVSILLDAYVYRGVSGLLHMQWAWIIFHLLQFHSSILPLLHRQTLHQRRCFCFTCKSCLSKSLHP